ncbi:MAG: RES domain-containing protein, partial [Bradyrhizobium sp.]
MWRRLYQTRFRDPLGYGFGPSRFSDPETGLVPPERFGVVYLGSSVKVCFVEAILRDRGRVGSERRAPRLAPAPGARE